MNRKQRHLGRELALQWLFQIDLAEQSLDDVLAVMPPDFADIEEEGIIFAQQLVRGVVTEHERIDAAIEKYTRGWALSRMPGIDRNILRIAMYEILDLPEIPPSVTIDEAVLVAKRYGTDESAKFINGILGAYMRGEQGEAEMA